MRTKRIILLLALLVYISICFGSATTHSPWDGTKWDVASPNDEALVGNTYKEIYDLRKGIAIRINKEHETLATSSAGGEHVPGGCAVLYYDTTTNLNTAVGASTFVHDCLLFDTTLNQFFTMNAAENAKVAIQIDTDGIAADAINETKLEDDSIDSEHYNNGSIDLAHMSANSVDSDQYVDGSIDLAHMSANSVDSNQYVNGSIDAVHLAADVIDETKIADNGIDSEHYNDGSIDAVHIGTIFGARTLNDTTPATLVKATIYQSQVDGFLTVASTTAGNAFTIYIEAGDSSPDVAIAYVESDSNIDDAVTVPIKKDDYVQVAQGSGSANPTMSFVPIGAGGLVAQ